MEFLTILVLVQFPKEKVVATRLVFMFLYA